MLLKEELRNLANNIKNKINNLEEEVSELKNKLNACEMLIQEAPSGPKPKHRRNRFGVHHKIAEVLEAEKELDATDILDRLKQRGDLNKLISPTMTIYASLHRHPDWFERVGRKWRIRPETALKR